MSPTRVLVVEDSPTVRAHLVALLRSDPGIEVVGEASNGKDAIAHCQSLRPDVITMDMVLPVMSGLAATEFIMAHCPTPILIVSASTNRGDLFKTYEALAAGAIDVMEKPLGDEHDGAWEQTFLGTVKLIARISVITHPRARLVASEPARLKGPQLARFDDLRHDVVVIGASTGGPGAIAEVLRGLSLDVVTPVLVVLHIGAPFGTDFADWLDGQILRPVVNARGEEVLSELSGSVVVAVPDRHLVVRSGRLRLLDEPERHSCRPSIDVLFESVANECGSKAIACLLTGMGKDGALGLRAIRQCGGVTLAQDEPTSVVYGMPREAALLGAAEHILPLDRIGPTITRLAGSR